MDIGSRKQKWLDLMDLSSDVKTVVQVAYNHGERPWPYPENFNKRFEWSAEVYENQIRMAQWLDDDRIPSVNPYTGTEIFAEAFGCKVHLSGDNMPFALPMVFSAAEAAKLKIPDIHNSTLEKQFEMAAMLKQRCGKDAVLHLPDIQSPIDISALIWEKSDFLISMLDDPEAVLEISKMTEQVLVDFLDEWFKEFGTEYMAHYPDYYMKGGMTVSEDEVGEISSGMFGEFCLEPLNRLSERYGGIGIHCCANAKHQYENFKRVKGLKLINLIQPPEITKQAFEIFAGKSAQMHNWCGNGKPSPDWAENYPPEAHVVLAAAASTKEEALEVCKRLREIEAARAVESNISNMD